KRLVLLLASWLLISSQPVRSAPEPAAPPERIPLWNGPAPVGDGTQDPANAFITVLRAAKPNGTAIVICPGGGYGGLVTGPEGTGIARWLNQQGIGGIVLEYRLPHGRPFVPLLDAQRAIRTVRSQAKAWGFDPRRIGIMGFSAGGHLAATAATHFDAGNRRAKDPIEKLGCRPDFAVLVYPVVSLGAMAHGGSKANLLGTNATPAMVELFSNEKQVTARTSPTFLAHAADDRAVSPENSRLFHAALKAHGVPTHYLELPSGDHGLNGYKGPMWDAWQTESLKWIESLKRR
ncbi:MAG: alpha/beta hydrolase, partial [Verrucomicrobia bacterium]